MIEEDRKSAAEVVFCIAQVGGATGLGRKKECEPFADIAKSARAFQTGLSPSQTVELVPDGVASVRVTYAHLAPAMLAVSENSYLLAPPKSVVRAAERLFTHLAKNLKSRKSRNTKQQLKQIRVDLSRARKVC